MIEGDLPAIPGNADQKQHRMDVSRAAYTEAARLRNQRLSGGSGQSTVPDEGKVFQEVRSGVFSYATGNDSVLLRPFPRNVSEIVPADTIVRRMVITRRGIEDVDAEFSAGLGSLEEFFYEAATTADTRIREETEANTNVAKISQAIALMRAQYGAFFQEEVDHQATNGLVPRSFLRRFTVGWEAEDTDSKVRFIVKMPIERYKDKSGKQVRAKSCTVGIITNETNLGEVRVAFAKGLPTGITLSSAVPLNEAATLILGRESDLANITRRDRYLHEGETPHKQIGITFDGMLPLTMSLGVGKSRLDAAYQSLEDRYLLRGQEIPVKQMLQITHELFQCIPFPGREQIAKNYDG